MATLDDNAIPYKKTIEYSYQINHSISRVWVIIRDAPASSLLTTEDHFPIIITKGKETWTVGTEFCGKMKEFGEYYGKCIKVKNFPQIKKLQWEMKTQTIPSPIIYESQLYKTEEDEESTILLIKLKFYDEESYNNYLLLKDKYEKLNEKFINKINVTLTDSTLNLYQYEAGLIYSSMDKIWEFVTNLISLKKIAPLIRMDCDNEDETYSTVPGTEKKISIDNHKGYYITKTLKYDKRKSWNKWIFCYTISSGEPKVPRQLIFITLSKINSNECQLSFFNEFKEPARSEFIKGLSNQKKYIIQSIKDYLENYN